MGRTFLKLFSACFKISSRCATNKIRLYSRESKAAKYVFPIPVSAPLENRNIDTYRLGGIAMLESRKDNYYGFEVTMYRIGDHLWISNIMPNAQYLVNQFNYDKMIWTQTTYTTDEIEELFNISNKVLK